MPQLQLVAKVDEAKADEPQAAVEEKKESEEDVDMGGLFGDDDEYGDY